jgi:Peptidase M15
MHHPSPVARPIVIAGIALAAFVWAKTGHAARAANDGPAFRLTLGDQLPMLRGYAQPSIETPTTAWRFAWGPWGRPRWRASIASGLRLELPPPDMAPSLSWSPPALRAQWGLAHTHPNQGDAWSEQRVFGPDSPSFFGATNAPPRFWSFKGWSDASPADNGCEQTSIRFTRFQSETDSFPLLDCDGSVSAEAIDRLSIMARPPGVARPALPLPDEPADDAAVGEWLPSVRLLSPRLVWLVQQLAETYPHHGIYIVSGYRTGPNEGQHAQGRALDLQVMGVSNERLYRTCRRFRDVGCGYYPNHAFVHVDVRPAGTGSRYWVDVSDPGQPSAYVTSWPGVEDGRGARFDAGTR